MEKSRSRSSGRTEGERRRHEQQRRQQEQRAAGRERRAELNVERGEVPGLEAQPSGSLAPAAQQQRVAQPAGRLALSAPARQASAQQVRAQQATARQAAAQQAARLAIRAAGQPQAPQQP